MPQVASRKKSAEDSSKRQRSVQELLEAALSAAKQRKPKKSLPKRQTQYKRAIITFIDVLGFKKLIQTLGAAEIHHLLDRFRKELGRDDFDSKELSLKFYRFSDCLVRVTLIPADKSLGPDGLVFWELLGLALAQLNLIWRGVVVRGAVTIGDVHCSSGTVFGPGLVRAYELEQSARYPRIVVDPYLLKAITKVPLKSRDNTPSQELDAILELLSNDDEHFHIDYFKAIASNRDDDHQLFDFAVGHRDLVRKGLAANKSVASIAKKYRWMAHQHNAFVRALPQLFVHANGFKKRELYI